MSQQTTPPETIVLASGNAGKLKELQALFTTSGINVKAQGEFNVSDAEETGMSFVENAILKARHACVETGLPALADDSGLAVDALGGAPGIYSARFSGADATDASNNQKLLQQLEGVDDNQRGAAFHCVLVYMRHAEDPSPIICQAQWRGRILQQARGQQGFGYDPLFWVEEQQCASAELPRELKNTISHRALAIKQLQRAMTQT